MEYGLMMTVKGIEIGECLVGTELGIVDYSRKERDPTFGTLTIIERGYTRTVSYKVRIKTEQAAQIVTLLASVRADATVNYVGIVSDSTNKLGLAITGLLNSFSVVLDTPFDASLSLEVESGTTL
jgi:hypothetical protein